MMGRLLLRFTILMSNNQITMQILDQAPELRGQRNIFQTERFELHSQSFPDLFRYSTNPPVYALFLRGGERALDPNPFVLKFNPDFENSLDEVVDILLQGLSAWGRLRGEFKPGQECQFEVYQKP